MSQNMNQNRTAKKIEQAKHHGYTPERAICEFPDNIKNDVENVMSLMIYLN